MLEQLLVFTRGGLILWACKELGNALRGSPIDSLIRSCLLEERSGDMSYNYDAPGAAYTLKWMFHNDLGLVFVAVYQRIFHLLYVDDLLSMVKQEFSQIYDPKRTVYDDFDETFRQLIMEAEARAEEMKKSKQAARPGKKQGQIAAKKSGVQANGKQRMNGSSGKDDADEDFVIVRHLENISLNGGLRMGVEKSYATANGKSRENGSAAVGAFDVNKLQKLRPKVGKKLRPSSARLPRGSRRI